MATKLTKIVADFQTSLAAKIAAGGTTGTLISATDDDAVSLPAGNYFLTLDGDNSNKEHIVCALSGTALTSIKSVSRQGVQTSGAVREHRVGAKVVLTDFAIIKELTNLLDGTTGLDASNPLKYDADPTISDDKAIATKKYVDGVAVSGAPNASTTVKGIVEEATQAEIDAKTAVGGTGARLFTNPSAIRASNVNDYVASDTGAADAYAIATVPVIAAHVEGQVFIFKAANANTTASTLAVCGLATKPIVKNYNSALVSGDIKAGQVVVVVYDGTSMQMVSPIGVDAIASAASLYFLLSNLDTTATLGTSDTKVASQKAVKTYVDTQLNSRAPAILSDAFTVGDYVIMNDFTTRVISGTGSLAKVAEIKIGRGGAIRVVFSATVGSTNHTIHAQIYVNGSAVGTARTINPGPTEYTEDISGLNAGDLVQIYAYHESSSNGTLNYFRIAVATPYPAGIKL